MAQLWIDITHPGRSHTVRTIDNIESVRQYVTHNPQKSAPDFENIFVAYIERIFKVFERRLQFVLSFTEIFQQEDFFSLSMTDEAHFHLNSFFNKQNLRYWGVENSIILNEK